MHGVELIDAVIRKVKKQGFDILGTCRVDHIDEPVPVPAAALAKLRFPNDKPLSPALARWLAFDASWLGWFDDPAKPVWKPMKLGDYATREYDFEWGYGRIGFDDDVYGLHFGADSRRFLYVGEPDSWGEYPVLLTDTDDQPYLGVEYPGIDVYLALNAEVISYNAGVYGAMLRHPTYGARMKEHAKRYFKGKCGGEVTELTEENPAEFWAALQGANAERLAAAKKAKKQPAKKQPARKQPAKKKPAKKRS